MTGPSSDPQAAGTRTLETVTGLNSSREARFDRLVFTMAQLFRTPMAMLAIVESDRVWVKARVGPLPDEWPRDQSLCHTVIETDTMLVVENASIDIRFSHLPSVTGPPHIRFYAGCPVHGAQARAVAALCVLDSQPRTFLDRARQRLTQFARETEMLL